MSSSYKSWIQECKSYESEGEQIKRSWTLTCGGQKEIQRPSCEMHRCFMVDQHQLGTFFKVDVGSIFK